MFDTSPENLKIEIQAAVTARDKYLSVLENLIKQRAGPAYKDWKQGNADEPPDFPENHIHEYLSLTVPRLVFDNPRVAVSSRKRGSPGVVAEAVKAAINDWVDRTRFYKILEELANDFLLMWSASKVSQAPQPDTDGADQAPQWPVVERIPQRRFVMDPMCLCPADAAYMGELICRNKADLLKEAENPLNGWDIDEINNLSEGQNDDRRHGGNPNQVQGLNRGDVWYYEIWVRDARIEGGPGPDQGFNGVKYTISPDCDRFLREPRPYYGPSNGPYYFAGVHKVVDSPWPLSPIVATYQQTDELNAQARAISLANRRYKRMVFVDGTNPQLVNKVKGGQHDYVIPVPSGLSKGEIVAVEVGGATDIQLKQLALLADRLNRVSGIQDAQRGDVSGVTATEVSVADQASEARMAHAKRCFTDYVSEILRGVAWFLVHDDRVVLNLGDDFAGMAGMFEPVYFGGPFTEDAGATFDDLELDIEPYSMERTGEAMMQRNALQAFEIVKSAIPIMPTAPFAKWKKLFTDLGNATNNPTLGEAFDWDMLAMLTGLPPQGPTPMPGMGRQIGLPTLPPGGGMQQPQYDGNTTGQIAAENYQPMGA